MSFLAVILLVTTTACNGTNMAENTANPVPDTNPTTGKVTSLYKPLTPPAGGMNNYSDVDPRMDTSKADAKTDRLIKKTDDLVKKDTNPFKQIRKEFDDKGVPERAANIVKDVNRSAKETADGVAKGTERGFGNLKENTKSFAEDVKSAAGDLKDKTKQQTKEIERDIRKNS
jgi:ElaB/YqjD/DUF883 family membrane-anchored ribosome-binding protein